MYGTIIQDAYSISEVDEIIDALNDLCDPLGRSGWASAGLYCFWKYDNREILYIGLALDLAQRFRQHHGRLKTTKTGSKYKNIKEYFSTHKKMGYSILVQSSIDQPVTGKNIYSLFGYDPEEFILKDFNKEKPKVNLRMVEGICIEAYRRHHGSLPPWNKVEGSIQGKENTVDGNYQLVDLFRTNTSSPLVSKFSLRQLSNNAHYEGIELFLHGARQYMLSMGLSYEKSLELLRMSDNLNRFDQLKELNYFNLKVDL